MCCICCWPTRAWASTSCTGTLEMSRLLAACGGTVATRRQQQLQRERTQQVQVKRTTHCSRQVLAHSHAWISDSSSGNGPSLCTHFYHRTLKSWSRYQSSPFRRNSNNSNKNSSTRVYAPRASTSAAAGAGDGAATTATPSVAAQVQAAPTIEELVDAATQLPLPGEVCPIRSLYLPLSFVFIIWLMEGHYCPSWVAN